MKIRAPEALAPKILYKIIVEITKKCIFMRLWALLTDKSENFSYVRDANDERNA